MEYWTDFYSVYDSRYTKPKFKKKSSVKVSDWLFEKSKRSKSSKKKIFTISLKDSFKIRFKRKLRSFTKKWREKNALFEYKTNYGYSTRGKNGTRRS